MSDFSNQLKRQKEILKPSVSRVTQTDGRSWLENNKNEKMSDCEATCPGFVVDTKPDLRNSLILPQLLLGSQDVAHDLDILTAYKVSHILNVSTGVLNLFEGWFIYKTVQAYDTPNFQLIDSLEECCDFIQNAIASDGCVLVHCNAGVSRSATVVIAYLMKQNDMTRDEALNFVKERRSFIRPNEGFLQQLKIFENKLKK